MARLVDQLRVQGDVPLTVEMRWSWFVGRVGSAVKVYSGC
jgi:hypothetical protein